jgi:phosphate:Na+ symporter
MLREIILPFATGLTIFLFGLRLMRLGLERLAGNNLEKALLRFTRTPVRGFITGIVTTALLQSSSAVTVLTIGFVDAGILTFAHSLGVILGTNIGTTVTTEILALKIEDFAMPLLFTGAVLFALPSGKWRPLGLVIGGFGLIFLGIDAMKGVTGPLEEHGWIEWMMKGNDFPILTGIATGTFLTALIHSSSACIAITMGFYASGLLPLPFALAVVFGSNVGTCATALIASVGTGSSAKQVALSHLVLNVAGVALFAPFIPWISLWVPALADNPATQLAHIQTLFNIVCSLAVLPFTDQFARGIMRLIPDGRPA